MYTLIVITVAIRRTKEKIHLKKKTLRLTRTLVLGEANMLLMTLMASQV